MLMFTGNLILREKVHEFLDKVNHFFMPWYILHGEGAGFRFTTVGYALRRKLKNKWKGDEENN